MAAKRYGLFFLPFAPLVLSSLYFSAVPKNSPLFDWMLAVIVPGTIAAAAAIAAAIATARRRDAFYDKFVGTRVIQASRLA
jgi:hypothetical protein